MENRVNPNELCEALAARFDEQELQTLCFELQVDYQSLPAVGKANKARELLLLLARQDRLDELLGILPQRRPNENWPDAMAAGSLTQAILPQVDSTPSPTLNPAVSVGGSVHGPVSGGDMTINAPVAGGDLTINPETPRWQRWILVLLLPLLIAVFIGVFALVRPLFSPTATAPEVDQLRPVMATVSPPMTVTAMTLAQTEGGEILWFGAWQEGRSALYKIDVAARETAVPALALNVQAQIRRVMVDCRQNIWLALDEVGVLVYQPASGRQDLLLDKTTAPNLMAFNTMAALAHRCGEAGEVDVWLGRTGIRTVRYQADYPTLDALTIIPPDEDPVFAASQNIAVTDLLYVPETAVLWATGQNGELLSISTRSVRQPALKTYENDALWSLSLAPDGAVWAGSSHHLIEDDSLLPLGDAEGRTPDSRARVLAAGQQWVWFGDRCSETALDCWVLGAYQHGRFFSVDLNMRREVTGIVIDGSGVVWIGTENGLVLYF